MSMIQTATATALSARSAEAALVAAIHGAADALDGIGRDPLVESLSRLTEAAANAQARLRAGRMRAASLLFEAIGGFEEFEQELAPVVEPVVVAELPAPAPLVEPEPVVVQVTEAPAPVADEVVTATAANGPVEAEGDEPVPTGAENYPSFAGAPMTAEEHAAETACGSAQPPTKGRGRGRKGK